MLRRLRPAPWVVVPIVSVLIAAGCGTGPRGPEPEGATRTVEAANGEVEVPAQPRSIAVLWRPTLSAVTELGFDPVATLGDPGADDGGLAPFLPEDHRGRPPRLISDSAREGDIDIEELANAAPDLIIGVRTQSGAQADLLPRLEEIAPTVLLEWTGSGSWRDHLTGVAEVLDAGEQAEQVRTDYEAALQEARAEITDVEDTTVSLIRLQSESEIRFETSRSFPGQVIADLGFPRPESLQEGTGGTDYVAESYENLIRGDGDVVFVFPGSGYADAPGTFDGPLWSQLRAVREERIFAVDYDEWGAASHSGAHRIIDDVRAAFNGDLPPAV
ncbi:iron complex transport system substrate-binding protein [Spinactinospora alkalitolerans]|uniref:Iron complex transport system substrate-binding protein n=1 Tax=Spinactinospora alkalitolerans TaxID=687207 RepID=A0A852TWF0_9ACTN|nr:iron-siderophore ABC transporter substrate-binding protein [Spinactinospora alkalitolerans]NYE48258.1 iron complex transport system substrate-binding protein [Spinactinospora alkalitolerans]